MVEDSAQNGDLRRFRWLGNDAMYLDSPHVTAFGTVAIGCYGGHHEAGADKNEDAALVWCAADGTWEFALLLDAHASADSAALVLVTVAAEEEALVRMLGQPVTTALFATDRHFVQLFGSAQFRARCQELQGETACLICVRKEQFLWWFSVGDCLLALLHPDLAERGQFALNQRSFFEWIGRVNTFALPAPCYSSGVRELRSGTNVIVLTTDGLLEYPASPFADPGEISRWFMPTEPEAAGRLSACVQAALTAVHQAQGRDSATVIAWAYDNPCSSAQPSDRQSPRA